MKIKINKSYETVEVFKNLEMEIKENSINIIVGPSGCGKTTLLHCIAGISPYNGMIENTYKEVGYVFQEDRLFPYLTILKNLSIVESNTNKIEQLLKEFNVYELKDKYPKDISGGEKQRISIIRAILGNHPLILMDEPFKSLDYHLKFNLIRIIEKIQKQMKKTMIIVTHDLDLALYLGDYIHVLTSKVTELKECIKNLYVNQELNESSVHLRNKLKKLML